MKSKKLLMILGIATIFMATTAFAQVYPEGMVSYWKFDEDSGGTAYDSVSNNDGTIYGATRTAGQVDDALSFDGVDDYVQVPPDPSFNIFGDAGAGNDTAGSVVAWIKMDDAADFFIVGTPTNDPDTRFGAWVFLVAEIGESELLRLIIYDSDGDGSISQSSAATLTSYEGQWIHVAATYDGSTSNSGIKLYLNGTLINSNPGGIGYNNGTGNSGNLNIGYWSYIHSQYGLYEYAADGLIDEVAIYDKVLTAAEIQQHYQNGLNGQGYELPVAISCDGFEPPMDKPIHVKKKNRVLPLKMVCFENGTEVTDLNDPPVVEVDFNGTQQWIPTEETALPAGQGDEGNQFVYSGDHWQFNLKTTNFSASGMYTIRAVSGDSGAYVINPYPEATFETE